MGGEFGLTLHPAEGENKKTTFNIPFTEKMGVTNFAKMQDWNIVTVTASKQRVVANVNGHQLKDVSDENFPSAVRPALTLLENKDAEAYFKEFEILDAPQ